MPVPFKIPQELLQLDLRLMCLYDFALTLHSFENQSIFEPIRCQIPKEKYFMFFDCVFPDFKKFIHLVEFEFIEYLRVELLHLNGFKTASGYFHSKKHLENVNDWFL